jgi:hypothetical protein
MRDEHDRAPRTLAVEPWRPDAIAANPCRREQWVRLVASSAGAAGLAGRPYRKRSSPSLPAGMAARRRRHRNSDRSAARRRASVSWLPKSHTPPSPREPKHVGVLPDPAQRARGRPRRHTAGGRYRDAVSQRARELRSRCLHHSHGQPLHRNRLPDPGIEGRVRDRRRRAPPDLGANLAPDRTGDLGAPIVIHSTRRHSGAFALRMVMPGPARYPAMARLPISKQDVDAH